MEAIPESPEEAAALLGATLIKITVSGSNSPARVVPPPAGMHPAFLVTTQRVGVELVTRLVLLRSLLRTVEEEHNKHVKRKQQSQSSSSSSANKKVPPPLPSAPSILQVLKKLLGISTQLGIATAAAATRTSPLVVNSGTDRQASAQQQPKGDRTTPPMLSTPTRTLWVECVVLCFALHPTDVVLFGRQMMAIASVHPRSAKAAGGVRIAALEVLGALLQYGNDSMHRIPRSVNASTFVLASQLAPWSLDFLQVCLKALRSAGNGEPTYRLAAIAAASATAVACRNAAYTSARNKSASSGGDAADVNPLLLPGATEEKAIVESIKILKQAVTDKYPEVRSMAATMAAMMAPISVGLESRNSSSANTDQLSALEEILQLSLKNIDDDSPVVADGWAEAAARCLATANQYHEQRKADSGADGGGTGDDSKAGSTASPPRYLGGRGKHPSGIVHTKAVTVKSTIQYLVNQFIKVGGELAASRSGGTFSLGGRAVRLGYCLCLTRFLRIESSIVDSIGESRSISMRECFLLILEMVGSDMDRQHASRGTRNWSKADATLARLWTGRVLRQGLSELAGEASQIGMLHELVSLLPTGKEIESQAAPDLSASQTQVILVELSHLLATLGEASQNRVPDIQAVLRVCISLPDAGVRHEAAVAATALTASFAAVGRKLVVEYLDELEKQYAELAAVASGSLASSNSERGSGMRMFRRSPEKKNEPMDNTVLHQSSIHGLSLTVSVLVKDLPKYPGGLPRELLGKILAVAEILVSSQFNEGLTTANAGAACVCVQAGFSLISSILSTGPSFASSHMLPIFEAWKKGGAAAKEGGKHMELQQDLVCVDALLLSVVVFLKFCSELLLTIPEALNQVSVLLEDVFFLIQPKGRLGSITPMSTLVMTTMESSTASLLEAFSWLPSGSFPIVADEVFSFAAKQLQKAIEENVTCSILNSLVSKEDSILDSTSYCRAKRCGQLGGSRDIEASIISLNSEVAFHFERESVLQLRSDDSVKQLSQALPGVRNSSIQELFLVDSEIQKPPTPLHEVGTWRRPFESSCSSKIRVVDASIQAFSATFGLKDGFEQQGAMDMLESLVPPLLAQLARTIGINSATMENERRTKGKEDSAAVANITAVLLSCLQALPLHEATHNIPIGLGPPWMNKAKDLLLTLLPSSSTIVRRASAQGLALLATLGVTEDAHFLQSTLLHSLDEVMQGNKPDGKIRAIAFEPVSAARAGSLLTLACIQRTAHNVSKRKCARARARASGSKSDKAIDKSKENLPVLQMMTRILPSAACNGFVDYFGVKTCALHSFAVLLIYSSRLESGPNTDDDLQLLRKAVELVEDNFCSSWAAASTDADRGQEEEKVVYETAFLAVLLRLMSLVLPFLHHLQSEDSDIVRRFTVMVSLVLESHGHYSAIMVEGMAFFEVLASYQHLLPPLSNTVVVFENPHMSCVPKILDLLTPTRPSDFAQELWQPGCLRVSSRSLRAATHTIKILAGVSAVSLVECSEMRIADMAIACLEGEISSRCFNGGNQLRCVATSREVERIFVEETALEHETFQLLHSLLLLERPLNGSEHAFLRFCLFSQQILSPSNSDQNLDEITHSFDSVVKAAISRAESDTLCVRSTSKNSRWQVKCLAAQLGAESLHLMAEYTLATGIDLQVSSQFELTTGKSTCHAECKALNETGAGTPPSSKAIFHLENLLGAACMSSVATLDHAELRILQESSLHFLERIVQCFGRSPDPEDTSKSILDQYSTQIFSSAKHGLGALDEDLSQSCCKLFVAGCGALEMIVETQLAADPAVMKRLIRPIVPRNAPAPFPYKKNSSPKTTHVIEKYDDSRVALSVQAIRLCTLAKLLLRESSCDDDTRQTVSHDLLPDSLGVAIHATAAAIDGCSLLYSSNLSLVGMKRTEVTTDIMSGVFYENGNDLDDFTKETLACTWSSSSSAAVQIIVAGASQTATDEEYRSVCQSWIEAIFPLFLAGTYDAVKALTFTPQCQSEASWARGINKATVLTDCLSGLSDIVSQGTSHMQIDWTGDIDKLARFLHETVLSPALLNESEKSVQSETTRRMISDVCAFLLKLAATDVQHFNDSHTGLLLTILEPLNEFQRKQVQCGDTGIDEIISTCLQCAGSLITRCEASEVLVKAMLHLALDTILVSDSKVTQKVRSAAKKLLLDCLNHKSVNSSSHEHISFKIASAGDWDAWAATCTNMGGRSIGKSSSVVKDVLRDPTRSEDHLAILHSIRSLTQTIAAPDPTIGHFLNGIGADLFSMLYQYGTSKIPGVTPSNRTAACADAMKIMLVAYRQVSKDSDDRVTNFLTVMFETLLAVLRFNGLPNHASPEPLSDPAFGRMTAQAILHVARTTPLPFKTAVAILGDLERSLLEFAVRAEMSGYATTEQQKAPAKKKLALKGFKK